MSDDSKHYEYHMQKHKCMKCIKNQKVTECILSRARGGMQ